MQIRQKLFCSRLRVCSNAYWWKRIKSARFGCNASSCFAWLGVWAPRSRKKDERCLTCSTGRYSRVKIRTILNRSLLNCQKIKYFLKEQTFSTGCTIKRTTELGSRGVTLWIRSSKYPLMLRFGVRKRYICRVLRVFLAQRTNHSDQCVLLPKILLENVLD